MPKSRPNRSERPEVIGPRLLRRWPLPMPDADGDKDARGSVLVVAGCRSMPGAAILAATSAQRGGAGKVQIAVPRSVAIAIACEVPESYVHALPETRAGGVGIAAQRALRQACESADVIVLGPGMKEEQRLDELVLATLRSLRADQAVVLDAAALACLAPHHDAVRALRCRVTITPHTGEMATLAQTTKERVDADPVPVTLDMARRLGAVVACKGPETFVSDGKRVLVNRAGDVGLAMSGSGDTLSGVLAALLSRKMDALAAVVWAVHLHARAGERLARRHGRLGYLARELLDEVPALMAGIR